MWFIHYFSYCYGQILDKRQRKTSLFGVDLGSQCGKCASSSLIRGWSHRFCSQEAGTGRKWGWRRKPQHVNLIKPQAHSPWVTSSSMTLPPITNILWNGPQPSKTAPGPSVQALDPAGDSLSHNSDEISPQKEKKELFWWVLHAI